MIKLKKLLLKIYLSYCLGFLEFYSLSKKFSSKLSLKMDKIQQRLDEL